jgi:outer membrane immunogenic protein
LDSDFGVFEMFISSLKNNRGVKSAAVVLAASAMMLISPESKADSGFYLGGSVGQAGIEIVDDSGIQPVTFNEDDFAWKAFGGFNFDLPVINLAVEGGYVNLGGPSGDLLGAPVEVTTDGFDVFGVVGVDLGPLGVFAKYGMISWDAEFSVDGLAEAEDGSDPAYGVGASIGLGSVNLRAEYEVFDIADAEDVSLVSVGIVWTF